MSVIETKYQNRMNVEHDMGLCFSKKTPRFHKLTLQTPGAGA